MILTHHLSIHFIRRRFVPFDEAGVITNREFFEVHYVQLLDYIFPKKEEKCVFHVSPDGYESSSSSAQQGGNVLQDVLAQTARCVQDSAAADLPTNPAGHYQP